jgi:preprotein translocase SecE subunit
MLQAISLSQLKKKLESFIIEFRKVVWPANAEVNKILIVVILLVCLAACFLVLVDQFFSAVLRFIAIR